MRSQSLFERFLAELRRLARLALGLVPPKPAAFRIGTVKEVSMIRYTIQMPAEPLINDLAKRVVLVSTNAAAPVNHEFAAEPDTRQFDLDFQPNDSVSMILKDVDKAGNESEPSDPLTFTATIPDTPGAPPKPGVFGVLNIVEIPDVPAAPPV